LRRQAATRIISFDEVQGEEAPQSPARLRDWRELPSEMVERKEIRKLLQDAIEILPPIYRQVFFLRDVEELTVKNTATLLNISTSLVKVRLHRARIMLQRLLAPKLYSKHSGNGR
jgi:RNA polymerase sigma-70 factor, ECF subfamily